MWGSRALLLLKFGTLWLLLWLLLLSVCIFQQGV